VSFLFKRALDRPVSSKPSLLNCLSCLLSTTQACSPRQPLCFLQLLTSLRWYLIIPLRHFNMPSAIPPRLQFRKGHEYPSTPQYSAFSMEMQPSPAFSTTALRPGRESTTPNRETFTKNESSTSLRLLRMIHSGRIVISVVLIAAAAAMVGCEAHALQTYNSTNLSSEWFLPLWPQNFDLRPSIVIMVGGAVIILTSSLYLFCAVLPAVRQNSLST
jgi:hypothetical protein